MRRLKITFFLTLLLSVAIAQPRLPKDYYWKKLSNGLEVVVIENNKVPLATIEIAVKNGAYTEGPEYSGLSHLFEHMFFKANKDYPDQEKFLKRTQQLGAVWNGTTGDERVNYFFTFDKDSLDAGLKFMNAAIRFPIYRPEDMAKERPVVDGEFQRAESDPQFLLFDAAGKKVWGDLFTRKNPIGDHNIINTATPAKMMIIKDKYYFPNNSLLTICGDVKHKTAFALAEKIYGDWANSGFNPHEKYPIPEFKPLVSTDYFVKQSTIAQTPNLLYIWQGPDTRTDSAATLAADVFNTALGLNSSKWQQALVDKGLTTFASVQYQTEKYVGPIVVYTLPNPHKLKECYEEIAKQVKMWGDPNYITDEEMETAKQVLRRNNLRQQEKPSSLPSQLSYFWCSASFEFGTDIIDNYMKVTKSDIKRYVDKYITGKNYVAGMVISPEMDKSTGASAFFKPNF